MQHHTVSREQDHVSRRDCLDETLMTQVSCAAGLKAWRTVQVCSLTLSSHKYNNDFSQAYIHCIVKCCKLETVFNAI